MAKIVMMAKVHKVIREEARKRLIKMAVDGVLYIGLGKALVSELSAKYVVPLADVEVILRHLSCDLTETINKL